MSGAPTCAPADDEVAGVRIPRTPMAIEAAEAACASLPPVLTGHACRVFVLASLAARRAGETLDADALYVAAMYANMGLSPAYCRSSARYEVDSADAAHAFLLRHHTSQRQCDDVWRAIALHTTPGVAARVSPLACALAEAVAADLMASGFDAYSVDERRALLAAYPREDGFGDAFLDAVARGVAHRPASTFGTWSADVLERADPDFQRPNFCGRVLGARWKDV
ncbi:MULTISPECIES: phosphohydrolase [unclassified Burkholderia]|uniref:phosphohydrolase n=1 Tax=unclassified Burkholderia TaxID=2613784 RepID=UPI000F56C55E|nr:MULTISPECIES: phosphohydrolase [unclassified Burkholderia]RQR35825.1 phosphohydrolase [Burkholderia sp. Bp9131]RQR63498.1 phosphohydrolase [Burkholderia sp. Bp9015]RQS29764.1 phosphohydrolase [Burkholderia sp. Bp8995]RQS47860.1 phosphohydrolase [Burkholderia sp. Bp8989]RQS57870.1 phosphohydrolase [Burkholderia sp. Bp8984]